jgi:two-component system response regulator HydG
MEEVIRSRLLDRTPSLWPLVPGIAAAAAHDVTVLLTGETGTGKTYVARLMHECSPRGNQRFLAVPCGALAGDLVESELFGHVKGAFTGAHRTTPGKFAAAGAGTVLLDEIDALPLAQQAALLRVIETGEFEPVGSNETQACTARIIVASNWDLEEAVARGRFRRDLYYRVQVMPFHLPPLRERLQDIGPLARAMAACFGRKFGRGLLDIAPEALAALELYPWPGNIRQLENVVQHAVLVGTGPQLLLQQLPQPVQEAARLNSAQGSRRVGPLVHQCEAVERLTIQRALVNNGFNRRRAASALGVSRLTLHKKMKKYGITALPSHSARLPFVRDDGAEASFSRSDPSF